MRIRAISLWEPYASAIALGLKQHETRSWETSHRGLLAIHASVRPLDRGGLMLTNRLNITRLHYGEVVAVVNLTDCIPMPAAAASSEDFDLGDWSPGRFAWKLDDLNVIEPVALKGHQGLWWADLPESVFSQRGDA